MTQNGHRDLIELLADTTLAVRRLMEGLSESDTQWKPASGEFSVVENICHLRDIEVEGYTVRIRRILQEDQPLLEDLDGAKLAQERDYNNQEVFAALRAFGRAREGNVRTLRGLTSEQLMRTGTFEDAGTITLTRLLELMREHDDVHIAEMSDLRRKIASRV
jgi:hypothetical protein